jgi:drug/metabolite transporter (DMT)-like permease
MSLIPLGDTAGKFLADDHSVPAISIAFTRFLLGAALVAPFISKAAAALFLDWRVWFRALLITGGITCIVTALSTEPLPNVFGAFFVGPIISYILSVTLLKEARSPLRAALLGIGFCGVLLVVKPGFGMTAGLGYAVLAGCFYGSFLTASRWLAHLGRPIDMLFTQLAISALITAPFGLLYMPPLTATLTTLGLLSALGSMLGNLLLLHAYRLAPASRLAPFVYFQLIAATILGWVFFADIPDSITLIGLFTLITSGFASALIRR